MRERGRRVRGGISERKWDGSEEKGRRMLVRWMSEEERVRKRGSCEREERGRRSGEEEL